MSARKYRCFDAIEVATCVEHVSESSINRIDALSEYDDADGDQRLVYSVYGHIAHVHSRPEIGGAECLADCPTREIALFVGTGLARGLGVPVHDFTAPEEK